MLSTVIISKNEQVNIRRCIESVLNFSDEIIIVDSFSTDKTKEIALSYPQIKMFERNFDNYITQKNYANNQATGSYVFSLDADEWCSLELIDYIEIFKQTNRNANSQIAIKFKRINYYKGVQILHGLWASDYQLRLWKISLGQWGGKTPHESVIFNDEVKIEKSKHIIYHNAYSSHRHFFNKSLNYARLAAIELSEKSYVSLFLAFWINPVIKFIKGYCLKLGFLDGLNGLIIAVISSVETFYKYSLAFIIKCQKKYNS